MEPLKNLVRVPPVMSSNGLESTTLGKTRVDKVVVVSWKYILSNWCFLEVFFMKSFKISIVMIIYEVFIDIKNVLFQNYMF